MKVAARSPATAKIASKPGAVLVVVVDLVVVVGSVAGVVLVVVVVDFVASGPGVILDVVVVDFIASEPGVVLVVATVVDLVSSSAAPRASNIIVATSMATSIFFIQNPLYHMILRIKSVAPKASSIFVL